ncbi:MAG: M20/M25/M40 family metallo-hydrolase [Archaeoglobaceae archaeon]
MLLKELVEIESPSGREERIKKFVREYLESRGYDVVEEELFLATNPGSDLIVATHLDTVASKSGFSFDGTYAYGTGVADAKASVAAMLEAADAGIDYTLAFFCEEEESGRGSKSFVELWKWGKYAIVMEPTQLKVASKHFGNVEAEIVVRGVAAHGATPEFGVNAIEKAMEVYRALKRELNISVLKMEGGGDEYIVPEVCRMKIDVLVEPSDLERVLRVLESVNAEVRILEKSDGFYSGRSAELLAKAMEMCGLEVEFTVMPSWTDAINLAERYDVVVWGPGELHLCHTSAERIKVEEIEVAKNVLVKLNDVVKDVRVN